MLGWDVGYVWPILEGVVVTQEADSLQHIAMGCPRDANTGQPPENVSQSRSNAPPWTTVTARREPPPYDPTSSQQYSLPQVRQDSRQTARREYDTESSDRTVDPVDIRQFRLPRWPHKSSSTFACMSCVLGLHSINRFCTLVYLYKGSFIVQFVLLSMIVGIPLLYLQMALGQYLGAGLLDMWYISPAFKGLGFAMLYVYVILGVYNAVPLSWLFVYFKDSFITLKDSYKWGRCHLNYARNDCIRALNSSSADFFGWTVPSYFHGRVLGRRSGEFMFGELKFEIAFNLCLVWLIIFICLSRGPKTLGKVVYVVGTLPLVLLIMLTMRMGQQWGEGIKDLFSTPLQPTLSDSSTWLLASREVFLTWGLLGAVALHLSSHNKMSTNITKTLLVIVTTTFVILLLAGFLFSCTASVVSNRNLSFAVSSYEAESSVQVLKAGSQSYKNFTVLVSVLGQSLITKGQLPHQSGYQVLRLATEVFPAALAVEGVRNISSFWSISFYTAMILFGLGQQAVLWFCVVESVISINYKAFKTWQTTLTFVSCNIAFLLGLPLTSNVGIYVIHYFDYCIGMLWWIVVLYLIMIFCVLFIRGRPCGTEHLVKILSQKPKVRSWALPILTVQWNMLLPLALLVLTIAFLRSSSMNPSGSWGYFKDHFPFWPEWAKSLMFCLQVFPLVIVMFVCAYKAIRIFFSKADLPLSERLRCLCCPILPSASVTSRQSLHSTSSIGEGSTNSGFIDDPPPKYTPPPSYSTATSRMLAKRLKSVSSDSCSVHFDNIDSVSLAETDKTATTTSSQQSENCSIRLSTNISNQGT